MTLDTGRRKGSVVRLQKDDTDNVIANVPLPLQLLRIVIFMG